jgi:hypothetical protein
VTLIALALHSQATGQKQAGPLRTPVTPSVAARVDGTAGEKEEKHHRPNTVSLHAQRSGRRCPSFHGGGDLALKAHTIPER